MHLTNGVKMKNVIDWIGEKLRNPAWFILAIVILTIAATQVFEGEFLATTWGGIVQVGSGLMALATYFALIRLSRHLSLTLTKEEVQEIAKNAQARALISAGMYVGCGLVILALWG